MPIFYFTIRYIFLVTNIRKEKFELNRSKKAVVIGQGNVALDVARMLLRSTAELSTTDITNDAINQLSQSTIQEVNQFNYFFFSLKYNLFFWLN